MAYNPQIGSWLQRDPLGFAAGDLNIGRFVGDNPTNETDPSGLEVAAWAHFNPLHLGGDNDQPLFHLTKDQHTNAHEVLRKYGFTNNDAGRAKWASISSAQRRAVIIESMRAAGIPQSMIDQHIDNIMKCERPGTNMASTRKTPTVSQKIRGNRPGSVSPDFIKAMGTTVIVAGVMYEYDQYVEAGWKGVDIATKIGLSLALQVADIGGELPAFRFQIVRSDRTLHVSIIRGSGFDFDKLYFTVYYYEEVSILGKGTWTKRVDLITVNDGIRALNASHLIGK
jgi:hypothetical protein